MFTTANQVATQEAEAIEDLEPWTVVPGGDVMLIVGAKKVRILAFASGMKEGNSLANRADGEQARIELTDDNPEAIYHELKILPHLQAGFDRLVASYWFDHGEGLFIMTQFFARTDIPLLEFTLELGDEPLGLRLALAIEELRLTNAYRNESIGLCLDCFVATTKTFVAQQPGCWRTRRHLVL
ncbi:hypothetical protein FPCIR_13569 [Fusarium pseudocircinatum]|uniref:Uncharacterized protein n=1 Tax=Fusarium pseudocircinatum TaxID=56676 RepID=A0A8H5NPR1_9HYPO|nr:hypothetical protein FPCIR_13569 [Fusarium pseudocircinatum]